MVWHRCLLLQYGSQLGTSGAAIDAFVELLLNRLRSPVLDQHVVRPWCQRLESPPVELFGIRGHASYMQKPAAFICDPTVGGQVRPRHGAGGGSCGWRAPFMVKLCALRQGQSALGRVSEANSTQDAEMYGVRLGGDGRWWSVRKSRQGRLSRELVAGWG